MRKSDITDVFFDLDHTLWDFDRNSALAFEQVFAMHSIELELNEFMKIYEPINFNYWKLYREERISKQVAVTVELRGLEQLRHVRFGCLLSGLQRAGLYL